MVDGNEKNQVPGRDVGIQIGGRIKDFAKHISPGFRDFTFEFFLSLLLFLKTDSGSI